MMASRPKRISLVQFKLVVLLLTSFCSLLSQVQAECDAPPEISFSRTNPSRQKSVFSEGEQVTYTCNPGFRPVGESATTCRGGQWTPISFVCHVIVCGDPGIPVNGIRIGSVFQFGSQVKFVCAEGYSLIGRKTTFCQSNQRWSNPVPVCEVSQCPSVQTPHNGRVFPSNRATFGTVVRYSCDEKYLWTGDSERTCLSNGTWSGSDGACEANCGPLTDVSENVMYTANSRTTTGAVITFKCPRGFLLHGSSITTCTENATWSYPSPTCGTISCGDPGKPLNGRRIGLRFNFGSSVTFQCNEGYTLRGRYQTFCQANQQWSNPNPYCEVAQCPQVYQPDYGRAFPTSTRTYGTRVKYSCQAGYMWTGTSSRTCQSDGTWSGEDGTCEVVNCGIPENVNENLVEYDPLNDTFVGDTIYFSCSWGYDLKGPVFATCGADGRWSVSTPRCMMSCAHSYIKHVKWESEMPRARHGQSTQFECNSEDHDPVPDEEVVTCDDGVWKPEPWCKYDKPGWCWLLWNRNNWRCSPY